LLDRGLPKVIRQRQSLFFRLKEKALQHLAAPATANIHIALHSQHLCAFALNDLF
jgi:hypothetical protein